MAKGSSQSVDYRIRPAKHSERHLFADLVARLERLRPVADFRYIGMGSIYFVDFILMHRMFGIKDMLSIEDDRAIVDRCRFNAPYDCIEVVEDSVGSALPKLLEDLTPTILWLDYDSMLSAARLEEIRLACASLAPPSLIITSVNVHLESKEERLAKFRERFGERDLSRIKLPTDLNLKTFPALMWEYIDGAIKSGVGSRSDGVIYSQCLHMRYRDGAEMLTVGGLLCASPNDVKTCDFKSLPFVKEDLHPYDLRVPKLTYRERKALDALLPEGDLELAPPGLRKRDIAAYAELYRHAPFYVDIEV